MVLSWSCPRLQNPTADSNRAKLSQLNLGVVVNTKAPEKAIGAAMPLASGW